METETPTNCGRQAHSIGPTDTIQKQQVERFTSSGKVVKVSRVGQVSLQKNRKVDDAFPGLSQPNCLDAHGSPKHSIPLAGSSAPRHFPEHPPTFQNCTAKQQIHFDAWQKQGLCCLAGRGVISQISWPSLNPTGEVSELAISECYFHLSGGSARSAHASTS